MLEICDWQYLENVWMWCIWGAREGVGFGVFLAVGRVYNFLLVWAICILVNIKCLHSACVSIFFFLKT